jgi:hypothetical protein
MIASVVKDWGPTIVGILGVLSGLATSLYVTRSQRDARRQDHEHDIELRRLDYEQGRKRRLDDETRSAAAGLAGMLTKISSGLSFIRSATASGDLDAVEKLLNKAQDQQGKLTLFLGPRHPLSVAAASALISYQYALGSARAEHGDTLARSQVAAGANPTAMKNQHLAEASRAMQEFWNAARAETLTGLPEGSHPRQSTSSL